jgi:hypothetical protein
MPKITRTVTFAVSFPDYRKADRTGEDGLWNQLVISQGDLTRAANHIITVLDLVNRGIIDRPTRADGTKVPWDSLAYELLKPGAWEPLNEPAYAPRGRRIGGGGRGALARFVTKRYKTDREARRKDKSRPPYSTFKNLPFQIRAQEIRFGENHTIKLSMWAREKGRTTTLTVRAVKPGRSQIAILDRIRSGEYKSGEAKLFRHQRKKKWMLALSWTGEVKETSGGLIAGVDLGMATTVMLGYTKPDGTTKRICDRICIPESSLRAGQDIEKRRKPSGTSEPRQ